MVIPSNYLNPGQRTVINGIQGNCSELVTDTLQFPWIFWNHVNYIPITLQLPSISSAAINRSSVTLCQMTWQFRQLTVIPTVIRCKYCSY